jgi:ADP-ribose pyrophosphatase YjhB (NUDIX family)
MSFEWLDIAKQIQSIAQAGLTFTENKYDIDRYKQLRELSVKIMEELTGIGHEKLVRLFASEKGYQTPKVDIRGVVFREDKILMVKETIDGHWSLPGGWADVGYTPFEVAVKEVWEESGLIVRPVRLLAVLDKKSHAHPPDLYHVYKIFILCEETGGELTTSMETSEAGFFPPDELPPLSVNRITKEQIEMMFDFKNNPGKPAICD